MAQKIEKSVGKKNRVSEENIKIKNSWDSHSSSDEKPKNYNDWDSDSDCKETLVVPFNKELLSDEPWDSESNDLAEKKYSIIKANEKPVESDDSDSLSIKSEIIEIESLKDRKDGNLFIEDLEGSAVDEKNSQDGVIPSARSNSVSEEMKLFDELYSPSLNKSKSCSDFENFSNKKKLKDPHSKSMEHFEEEAGTVKHSINIHEGSSVKKTELKDKTLVKSLTSPQGNFYREYECRMVIPEEGKEEANVEDLPFLTDEPSTSYQTNPPSNRSSISSESQSVGVIIRKSGKKHPARKFINGKYKEKSSSNEKKSRRSKSSKLKPDCKIKERPVTESWIFLDESGQSQQVTKNEVNILLNGKSADAVLQEQKEHLLSQESIMRNASTELLSTPILERNIQELVSQENVTEEVPGKSIGLERKLGNMLLYIRSRVDLKASVRFISVDTDMINMWRRSNDYIESSAPVFNESEKSKSENQIDLQSIIMQNSRTIESLAEDLKKFQISLEEERQRNLALEKEMTLLREINSKLIAENSARKSNVVECVPFEYSADACLLPIKETENKRGVQFEIEEAMPKFVGLSSEVLNEKPYDEVKSLTVNLFSTKNKSDNSSNNDDLQGFQKEEKSNPSETNPFFLENNIVAAHQFESKFEARSDTSSHFGEDSETESVLTNLEHKSRADSSALVKDLSAEVKDEIRKLRDNGIKISDELFQEDDPNFLRFYIKELSERLIKNQTENSVFPVVDPDEYYRTISEKAALSQEVANLKAENNLLLESQVEQYEKLKRTNQTLNEHKSKNFTLENEKATLKMENEQLLNKIQSYEHEKEVLGRKMKEMEDHLNSEKKKMENLKETFTKKEEEIKKANEKLKFLCGKFENFEEKQKSKDEEISKLKCDNKELNAKDSLNLSAIEFLTERVKTIESEKSNLESELTTAKISSEESMTYITNLEKIVHETQENLEKIKRKYMDSNETLSSLKKENEILNEKLNSTQISCKKLKDKLDLCKEKINELKNRSEDREKELEKIMNDLKRKNEVLAAFVENLKTENGSLKSKMSNSKDEFLKERKDLLNEIELAGKKIFKLDQKYRNLKVECNNRTNLIGHLEALLKKSVEEYNEKIVSLERTMSDILEKIEVYKRTVAEKNMGDETKVTELENQLHVADQEKWTLERDVANYYKMVKKLQVELVDKQKSLEEMNFKLMETEMKGKGDAKMNFGTQTVAEEEKEVDSDEKLTQKMEERFASEKKKLEKIISELKSENGKYEARIQVMMTNLSNCGKNLSDFSSKQRSFEENEKQNSELKLEIKNLTNKLNTKNKQLNKLEEDIRNSSSKFRRLNDDLKKAQSNVSDLENLLTKEKCNAEYFQKERNELADKLLQSVKLVMDERAAKQSLQLLFAEKEKSFKSEFEKKEKDLQDEVNRLRTECLKNVAVGASQQQNQKMKNVLEQLKNIRASNLELRKKEGELQGKIVLLEDELRNARINIKQMEGELINGKKLKETYRTMRNLIGEEIRRLQQDKSIGIFAADKIERHFNLIEFS